MKLTKKIQLEALLFFIVGAAVGFIALHLQDKPGEVRLETEAAVPTPIPKQNTPTMTTLSQISSDGTKKVIMHVTENNDGTKTYDISTSDEGPVLFAKLLPQNESISIPFNTWSANNNYFFIQENKPSGTKIFVFQANGEPFVDDEVYIDVTEIFENSSRRNSNDTFYEATGWAESNLLIINTKQKDNTQGASYWFEIPSKNIYRLAHQF